MRSHLADFHFDVTFCSLNRTDEVKITYIDGYFNANVEFDPIEVVCTATSVLVGSCFQQMC